MWRRAQLTDLQGGPPPLSAAAPGDCASVTPSMGRLPNKPGGAGGSPDGQSHLLLRKACHQGCWQRKDIPNSTPQQAATDRAPCHHHRASGRKTEPRTHTAARPERTQLCPLLLSPDLCGFWTPDFKAQTQNKEVQTLGSGLHPSG